MSPTFSKLKKKDLAPPLAYPADAVLRHPAPNRDHYFNSRDYVAACMRTFERRSRFVP